MSFRGSVLASVVAAASMGLLERQAPDALGARFVMLLYDAVEAVKLIDPLKAEAFAPLGFEGRLSLG